MISLVFGWFLSIVISEIFWYSGRVTGIFYSKEKKVYKQLLCQQVSMYGTGMETAIFYPEAERDKAFVIKCA